MKERLEELEDLLNSGEIENAEKVMAQTEEVYGREECFTDRRYAIIKAAILFQKGEDEQADEVIEQGLSHDGTNYELYYLRGDHCLRSGRAEEASTNFHAAFFWGRESEDRELLAQTMLKNHHASKINHHIMNLSLARLIASRMKDRQYEEAFAFLQWLFFGMGKNSVKEYLSEETMLQFMMLESTLAEKNVWKKEAFEKHNTSIVFHDKYEEYKEAYIELKHAVRRIWFGLPKEEQRYLTEVMQKWKLSVQTLAVVTKYSVPEEYWSEAFAKILAFLESAGREMADDFRPYARAVKNITQKPQKQTEATILPSMDPVFERIVLTGSEPCPTQEMLDEQDKEEDQIAVIFCTHDALMEKECLLYLSHLTVPQGMQLKVYAVWNAPGMCFGYNRAMAQVKAKYKLYIHHDSFLIRSDIPNQLMELFRSKEKWKMLGIAGATYMTDPYWWGFEDYHKVRYNLYQDRCMETVLSQTIEYKNRVDTAEAIDGIFLATSEDLLWREDVFDEWHFYDISQCYEFSKKGYRIGLVNDKTPWVMHETTTSRDPGSRYDLYAEKFRELYLP